MTSAENVRMSAFLKEGRRTDIWSDERPDQKHPPTSGNEKRPDETSGKTSGVFCPFPDDGSTWNADQLAPELSERLLFQMEQFARRRQARAEARAQFARRRSIGLQQRHATKLRREPPCAS